MEEKMIFQALLSTAAAVGDKPAFVQRDRSISFRKWAEDSCRFANFLRSLGVGAGDKVALHLPNSIEYAVAQFGTWGAGAVSVPLDMTITRDRLEKTLRHCEAKVLVTTPEAPVDSRAAAAAAPALTDLVMLPEGDGGEHSFSRIIADGDPSPPATEVAPSDHSVIYYTSGTTSEPKAILWNHRHLTAAPMIMHLFDYARASDVTLCAVPLSHGGGTVYLQNAAYHGTTVVMMTQFRPGEFVRLCEKHRVTCFHIVPAIFAAVVMTEEFTEADLSALRWVTNFGAVINEAAVRRFGERCPGARLLNGWGLMETAPPNTLPPLDRDAPLSSVGCPPPWIDLRVVDESDDPLPTGEVGEVVLRGWVVMEGYYKAPELTEQAIRNGWFHTGDLGRLDEEGYLYIVGRKKDVIIVGGLNVVAGDVEKMIREHPAVADCAVVPAEDPVRGEVVKAVVELKPGAEVTEAGIKDFLRGRLENYKLPRIVEFVDSLPRTRTGKVARRRLY